MSTRDWGKPDIDLLRELWAQPLTIVEIAAKMPGRTEGAVRSKARQLQLPKRRETFDIYQMSFRPTAEEGTERKCLCCGRTFLSAGNHNRMCFNCKTGASAVHDETYSVRI